MTDNVDDFDFPVVADGGLDRIPQQFRGLYQLDPDTGAARLIEPLAKKTNVGDGLKTALNSERQRAKTLELEVKKYRRLGPLDDVQRRLEEVDDLRRRAENPISIGADTEALKADFSAREKRLEAEYRAKIAERDGRLAKQSKVIEDKLIKSEAVSAIAAARGNARLLLPHILDSTRMVEDSDGSFSVRIVDSRGSERYCDDGSAMTIADLVSEFKKDPDFAQSFEGSGSTGTGSRGAGGGSGGTAGGGRLVKSYSKTDWRALMAQKDKDLKEQGFPGGRAQLMRDYSAGKIKVNDD